MIKTMQKGSSSILIIACLFLFAVSAILYYYYRQSNSPVLTKEDAVQSAGLNKDVLPQTNPSLIPKNVVRYEIQPTQENKIYQSATYGFSLTIPGEWGFMEYDTKDVTFGHVNTNDPAGNPIEYRIGYGISLTVYDNYPGDLTSFAKANPPIQSSEAYEWQKVKFGGLEGIQTSFGCQSTCTDTILKKDNRIFDFMGMNTEAEIVNPILETLKFN